MDNYKEIKNLIHNELNITKDDIKSIIVDTVREEIGNLIKDEQFLNTMIQNHVRNILNKEYTNPKYKKLFALNELVYDNVCSEISKMVHQNVKISVGLNEDNMELYKFSNSIF